MKKISERDSTSEDSCPSCQKIGTLNRQVGAPLVGYSTYVNGAGKPPEGFREVLRRIHQRAPGSQMDRTSSFLT
jgi:hypothetical protein